MTTSRRLLLTISGLLVLAVTACSSPAAATPEATAEPTVAATDAPASSLATATGAPASAPAADPWSVNAVEHRAAVGEEFTYDCPPADESRIDT
ncbi:MAG: hypothetical protein H0U86_01385, partial [Chloroflexi bacterium]|nr:hypothetical protein [Chloroflexota bacterium]